MEECHATPDLVTAFRPWRDALFVLVKANLLEFSSGNISALADSIPTSEEGVGLMIDMLKAYSDGSWTSMADEEPSEQRTADGPTVSTQVSDTS